MNAFWDQLHDRMEEARRQPNAFTSTHHMPAEWRHQLTEDIDSGR